MLHHMAPSGADTVAQTRQVRLFRNGRNQAVRIPREFELPGREATLRKVGHRLILEPVQRKSLLEGVGSDEAAGAGGRVPLMWTRP